MSQYGRRLLLTITPYTHTVTGISPFKVLFGSREQQRDHGGTAADEETTKKFFCNRMELGKVWGKVREKIKREKSKRVALENLLLTRWGE